MTDVNLENRVPSAQEVVLHCEIDALKQQLEEERAKVAKAIIFLKGIRFDCDDYAILAYKALAALQAPEVKP
jgi:hypothetical protein